MLVALPGSLAFGVAIYTAVGPGLASQGAIAGVVGAVAVGIVASAFGGTQGLISAPSAPAAAVMGALAVELRRSLGGEAADPARVLLLMTLAALASAALQVLYGFLRGGTLIKYIPYPVTSGYLSGVGIVIFLGQLPGLFGFAKGTPLFEGLAAPERWQWPGLAVGIVTIVVMLLAPRLTRKVPAAILGLLAGVSVYFLLGVFDARLLTLEANRLVIGHLPGGGGSFTAEVLDRAAALRGLRPSDLGLVLSSALTLSVLLSFDTLKTSVVVDALTRTRHNSNREIVGQGLANLVAAGLGGVPGSGTSGATLVNLASGGRTRLSGVACGAFVLVAYWLLGGVVAWAPIAALAGILVVVAYRMFDWSSFELLRRRSTALDFLVVASVIAVAVGVGLVSASGVGVGLSILLFIRDQVRGTVIRRRSYGDRVFSRQKRLPEEMALLERHGADTVIVELEGNLFFGTTDQLFTELMGDLRKCRFLILDLRRVRSFDLTAVQLLKQIEAQLQERGAQLLYSGVPKSLPSGHDLRVYFHEVGLVTPGGAIQVFAQLSDALEWVEDRILERESRPHEPEEAPLGLEEMDFLKGRKERTLREFEACVVERGVAAGERLFRHGDSGDEIFLIRRGRVRIALSLGAGETYHVATFGRGDFFGDIAFLDRGVRSADAVALVPTDLFVVSRERFDAVAEEHPRLGQQFFAGLARSLAIRLRQADGEIRALEEG